MNADWVAVFRQNADQAITDLFSGRAGAGSGFRLDVPELLYQAFPVDRADDREKLDGALLRWLRNMRTDHPLQVRKLGMSAYAKRLVDALVAIQLVDLPNSRAHIRSDLDAWLRWLSPLRLAPDRDPALECWRLVSRDQTTVGNAATWLRLAGDPRPEYFNVAWVGLKLLPNNGDARSNQLLMVHAAIRHASATSHGDVGTARKSCNRRLAVLRGIFPRSPGYWKRILLDVTDEIIECEAGFSREVAHRLRPDPTQGRIDRLRAREERPNTQAEFDRLKSDIEHFPSTDGLPRRLLDLSSRNLRFAEATGESYYFVRTLLKLGTQLLKVATVNEEELIELGHMIEHALAWQPAEPYAWGLWADWFGACDNWVAREWTLREMARLFPDNEYCRVELARLLMDRNTEHWYESVNWLRQAVERNPDKVHSHVELARILGGHGGQAEAIQLLDEVLARDPSNGVAKSVRDNLGHEAFGQTSNDRASPDRTPVACEFPLVQELERRGKLTREFDQASRAVAAGRSLVTPLINEEIAKGDSLAGFYAQWLKLDSASECPPHAWAWNACRHWQVRSTRDEWQRLAARFPEAATETEFLRILVDAHGPRLMYQREWSNSDYGLNGTELSRPAASFIRGALGRLDGIGSEQQENLALAVLASGAVGLLEFMGATS